MSGEPMRILLVEDNAGDARLLREGLRDSGLAFELVHVERFAEALDLLRAGGMDVVLLDLSLPDADGPGSVARAQSAAPALPVVVLTGLADERVALQAVQEGAQDYLVKGNVDPDLLVRSMRYAIERKRAEESGRQLVREQAARGEAENSARRWRFLAEASRTLAATLDYEATLRTVARLAVQAVADYCFVDLLEGKELVRVASAHADPAAAELVRRAEAFPADCSDGESPPVRALRSGAPVFTELTDRTRERMARSEEHRAIIEALGGQSLLCVPLLARGRTLGVMIFVDRSGKLAGEPNRALAQELAGRASLAVDNASLYQQVQLAARRRDEVIGIVSHDLRNPLNVITMMLAALRRNPDEPVEKRRKRFESMERSADRMTQLISDLLDVSRIEGGALRLAPEVHEVEPLVREAYASIEPLAAARSLVLECEVPAGCPGVELDRRRILQVFANLLSNSIRFTGEGGSITVRVRHQGDELRFTVSDTGSGIPEEELPHLFDRFWQGHRSSGGGAGLGLAIARGLVTAHGGRIWAESQQGLGTAVHFTLPLRQAPLQQDRGSGEPPAASA